MARHHRLVAPQPYRGKKGGTGPAGPSLAAMLLGRSPIFGNRQDASRGAKKMLFDRKRRKDRKYPRGV